MRDNECAERVRQSFASQLVQPGGTRATLINQIAADISAQCGVTRLRSHRLARGWTVARTVDEFHQMCRREGIKPRGLTERSWTEWEAGQRPSFDYQDLVSRLFCCSAVQLGWAADYSPAAPATP